MIYITQSKQWVALAWMTAKCCNACNAAATLLVAGNSLIYWGKGALQRMQRRFDPPIYMRASEQAGACRSSVTVATVATVAFFLLYFSLYININRLVVF